VAYLVKFPLKLAEVFGFDRAQEILILGDREVGFSPVEPGRRSFGYFSFAVDKIAWSKFA
jgi:hypothetical protein